jgi:hypothetical protein
MLWLATVCQFALQIYDDYWQQSQLWIGEEDTGGNRDLARIGRAYIRLSDAYERAEWEEAAHFTSSKGYAICYYFSFGSALTGTFTFDITEKSDVQSVGWVGACMHVQCQHSKQHSQSGLSPPPLIFLTRLDIFDVASIPIGAITDPSECSRGSW